MGESLMPWTETASRGGNSDLGTSHGKQMGGGGQ